MNNEKIKINGEEFYVIPESKKENYTLCIAVKLWGKSRWGKNSNGQQILDIADNRNPKSMTHEWYESLPNEIREAILTVNVETDDINVNNEKAEGLLEQTEMFIPSVHEWDTIPLEIRRKIMDYNYAWTRSYNGIIGSYRNAWMVTPSGSVVCNGRINYPFAVVPAFYISDNILKSLFKEQLNEIAKEKNPLVVFTIWPDYRITTSNILFRNMNTACCMDIRTMYETMQEISSEIKENYGYKVLFEVAEQ